MYVSNLFIRCLLFILVSSSLALALPSVEVLDAQIVVPEIVALGLKPNVQKITIKKLERLSEKEDQYYIDVEIGKVNQTQFQQLKRQYGNLSQFAFHLSRMYWKSTNACLKRTVAFNIDATVEKVSLSR